MELDQFILKLNWKDLRSETKEMARRCVLDAIGCSFAGISGDQFINLLKAIQKIDPGGTSPIWGTKTKMSLPWSIFLNSYTTAFFDLDDGHRLAQGHPGAAIIPATLGVAHQLATSGRKFLEAVVVGYEIAIRSAILMREMGGPRKGSGAWVVPGVAAAVSKLMNFDPERTLSAIGLAEFMALQAPQDRSASYPSLMKEGLPWGAYTGYMAAFLASHGFSGMRPYLADSHLIENLGEKFEIEMVYFKQYACCRWAHPAIDGLKKMFEELGQLEDEIDRIWIHTFEKALIDQRIPTNIVEALYSIPFDIASYIVNRKLGPKEVSGASLTDSRIIDLYNRIHLIPNPEFTKLFPEKCLQQIEVKFKSGMYYKSDILSAKGDPDNPFTYEELLAKFRILTENHLEDQWEKIPAIIKILEEVNVIELVHLLSFKSNLLP